MSPSSPSSSRPGPKAGPRSASKPAEGTGEAARPRREQKKALHRQRIVEAAREVFFRDGFMRANLDEVAQIADVAKGTLYRYFESKAELYVAVLSHNGEIFAQKMRDTIRPGLPPAEQVKATGRFYFEHWMRNTEYFQIFWALDNESVIGALPPAVVEEVTSLWQQCLQILADVIEDGAERGAFRRCDPWEVANILWTLSNGLIQTEMVEARRALRRNELQQVFDDAMDLLLRGIAA